MIKKNLIENNSIWVVIGVTTDTEKYGYKIYKRLKQLNYEVYGISPKYTEIDGDKIYSQLSELDKKPDVAVFVVNPKLGLDYIDKCAEVGIKNIWLQPGTISDDLLLKAKEKGINTIEACVLVETNG